MAQEERAYEQRYCAFLDILGFSDLIADIGRGRVEYHVVRELLRKIHQPSKYDTAGTADFRATTISDAICFSSSFSANGLAVIVDLISSLTLGALAEGYFMRGGLCRGLLYHDDDMVFGDAFITAYRIESTIARYPRVMLTKQVYDEALGSNLKPYFQEHLAQSDDGPYFVDVLEEIRLGLKVIDAKIMAPAVTEANVASFGKMRDQIQRRVAEAADNPNHFEKAKWFARYWNRAFAVGEMRTGIVSGPGLDIAEWRRG
jgi:hypothetical protein